MSTRSTACWLVLSGLLYSGTAFPHLESGLWYDRAHAGHGLDLHRAGGQLFGALYTYAADGQTEWYWLQTTDVDEPGGTLLRIERQGGQLRLLDAGAFSLDRVDSCSDGLPRPGARALRRFRFQLQGVALDWCVEPLLPERVDALQVLDGAWYDPSEPGWGVLAHHYQRPDGQSESYRSLYFHDSQGRPRWAFAQQLFSALDQPLDFYTPVAECLGCPPPVVLTSRVGDAQIALQQASASPLPGRNLANIALSLDGDPFERQAQLSLLSVPRQVSGAVSTSEGPALGSAEEGIEAFHALPFAQPPQAELRWRPPQPPAPRNTLLAAQMPGPACLQPDNQGLFGGTPANQSEDCLQLNLWRPSAAEALPVLVWIHGGGLTQGSAVEFSGERLLYDGSVFAQQGVLLVSLNYRLGPFGYLAHAQMDAGQPVNFGLQDQIAALAWLQQNLAAFGGDPQRVTLFGESAGAVSICALLAAPAAQGLFQRAILQSGSCRLSLPDRNSANAQAERVAASAGCGGVDSLQCLAALDGASLLAAANAVIDVGPGGAEGERFGLSVDPLSLPTAPGAALRDATAASVPLIIGVNDDEYTSLAPASVLPATVAGYEAAVRAQLGNFLGNAALARYPAANYSSPQRAYQDLLDDVGFSCPNRRAAAEHAANGRAVYHYVLDEIFPDPPFAQLESFHGQDIALLFGPRTLALPGEQQLAAAMQRAWIDFAHGAAPGSSDGLDWPAYDPASRRSRRWSSSGPQSIDDYHGQLCAFWTRIVDL